jgi:YggT family protein
MLFLAYIINWLLRIYLWVVIARAILSWVQPNPYNPIVRLICGLVDPVTYRISRIVPTRVGMIDLAPMILIVLIYLLQAFLVRALYSMAF